MSGQAASIEAIAAREVLNMRSARMILSLAFLAPDIIKAAVDGTLPRGFGGFPVDGHAGKLGTAASGDRIDVVVLIESIPI